MHKGIALAGGSGTRLYPLTRAVSKLAWYLANEDWWRPLIDRADAVQPKK